MFVVPFIFFFLVPDYSTVPAPYTNGIIPFDSKIYRLINLAMKDERGLCMQVNNMLKLIHLNKCQKLVVGNEIGIEYI